VDLGAAEINPEQDRLLICAMIDQHLLPSPADSAASLENLEHITRLALIHPAAARKIRRCTRSVPKLGEYSSNGCGAVRPVRLKDFNHVLARSDWIDGFVAKLVAEHLVSLKSFR
jgi:hypothetical protein